MSDPAKELHPWETEGKRVSIANINPGEVRNEFLTSLLHLFVHDVNGNRYVSGIYPQQVGGAVNIARNEQVERFLRETEFEWLLFIDSDIEFEPDTLDKLMEHADPVTMPILAGLYINCGTSGNILPMMYKYVPGEGTGMIPYTCEEVADLIHEGVEIEQVDGTGAGMLLVHRSVYLDMIAHYPKCEPWFAFDIINGVINGEDFSFCLRVKELGYKVYCHLGVNLTHIKPHGLKKEHLLAVAKEPQLEAAQ